MKLFNTAPVRTMSGRATRAAVALSACALILSACGDAARSGYTPGAAVSASSVVSAPSYRSAPLSNPIQSAAKAASSAATAAGSILPSANASADVAAAPKTGDNGFSLSGRGSDGFTIPVSDDASYMNAASQALARCGDAGKKPTAPTQRMVNGQTVLAYSCS